MKKTVLLVMFLVLITGCSVEYNVYIDEDTIKENVTLISENEYDNKIIKEYEMPVASFYDDVIYSESNEQIEGVSYYKISKKINNNSYYNLQLENEFDFKEYNRNNIIGNSVSLFNVEKSGDIYSISTGASIKAFDMYNGINKLKITISLDNNFKVINSNADIVNNNLLTWNIDSSEKYSSPITIKYEKKADNNGDSEKEKPINTNGEMHNINNDNNATILLLAVSIVFIIFIIIIILLKKGKRK